jgi:tellurite resistance protein TerC
MPWLLAAESASLPVPALFWEIFTGAVIALLLVDLVVFHRKPHEVRTSEAVGWTIVWVGLALAFNAWIWWYFSPAHGSKPAIDFFTAYVVEESLSVDNLFVFLLIFQHFKVPPPLQHRVLFFGILGAIVMRFAFIFAGIELIQRFHWINYVFGAFLVFTAGKLLFSKEEEKDPTKGLIVRTLQRVMPFVPEFVEGRLTVKRDGRRVATMLLLVILVVEATDVAFATDSIPAVIGVTQDRFIVFTSNVCAILGLRAIYFLLARFMGAFRYLKPGLAVVLGFVGVKMFGLFEISSGWSLAVIGGVLAIAATASLLNPEEPT